LFLNGQHDLFEFMKEKNASHYHRLMGFGLEKDIRYCLSFNNADILPFYEDGKLVVHKNI
ncbi:MAG TPA: 2-phosphosulfolactate phosphatase, partial [Puia sp.]|nr:2-phosphosulfolactate phosphatase [Puia sp.]